MPLAVFVAMTLGAWSVLGLVAARPKSAELRLKRLLDPHSVEIIQAKRQEQVQARVAAAAGKLGQSLRPSNAARAGQDPDQTAECRLPAGASRRRLLRDQAHRALDRAGRGVSACVIYFGMTQKSYMVTACAGGVAFYLPDFVVGKRKKSRGESIFMGLPDALDLMVVCVEAGLGLDAAMRRVTSELGQSSPVLCEEFAIANFQLQMGRPRRDVLRDLGIRTGVDDVRALAAVIIQAEKFGSSIAAALRVQSDAMRLRRRQLAEARAAETSVKIMIPLIFFIFPGVFVVLVGPAALNMSAMFGTK